MSSPLTDQRHEVSDKWRESYEDEDARWEKSQQVRDWLKLAMLIGISAAYHLLIFAFQPGLR